MGRAKKKRGGRLPKNVEDYGVTFVSLRCPRCKSKKIKCYSSHPPIRYHRCKKCKVRFKSIEEN